MRPEMHNESVKENVESRTPEVSAAASVAVQVQLALASRLRIMQVDARTQLPGSPALYCCTSRVLLQLLQLADG